MHPIMRQAKFAREVSRLLENAASEGQIDQADEYLTSDEAGFVYSCCDDQWTAEEVAESLIDTRRARYAVIARQRYGCFTATPEGDELEAMLRDAGRIR